MLQRVVHGEEISGIDIIMLRKDGSSFFANVSVFPLKNEMGEIIAFVGIGRDISENKKAQEILQKSEMLSVVGELAAGIAHEIRNPLTAIKGFMQLLKERNTNYVDAIEAMPNGGVVTLFVNRNGDGNVSIKVTDEGQGIPEDGLARLGEPFYSGKENGTGLGIVICHRIVEAHKGTLSFKSKLQQGTTVEINFPND